MRDYFDLNKYLEQLEKSESILQCEAVPVPEMKENQNYIFISYAHADYKKVYADLASMYHAGVRFWYDRGLKAGKNWDAEVKERILSPNCSGVIFFISEALFLSRSANMEIDLVCGEDGIRKNYFCVNLAEEQPQKIIRAIMRMDDQILDNAGFDMDRISILSRTFKDNQTFLYYSDTEHGKKLMEQIGDQFDVMDNGEIKNYALVDEESGEVIPINQDFLTIGRSDRKCHFVIYDDSVSSVHAMIARNGTDIYIQDMGAMNGTYIDGKRIPVQSRFKLHNDAEVRFGRKVYRFVEQ